ncbi:hypothetical protein [Microvirga tunisiensis]|uniref:WYL domain-containing protein n=1 Tax=Microvirga tunisiensis TaxID=2108360 RepID=A0A5N7MBK9_9HYPH|nr:hypothetical protein [Microvirga tunisiensis]MPR06302.1 hypothetical protein [Microvirga tunisiensis]MPR24088.1 hypothetical protein [Microvirga tunisiensis]
MAKRTSGFGGWGTPPKRPTSPFASSKQADQPYPRKPHLERQLCEAIQVRKLVEIRYEDDLSYRLIAPHAVYKSTKDKVNVVGTQISNPGQPMDRYEPRIFEIGKIADVRITGTDFTPDARFDRFDPRYKGGIICSV